MPPTSVAGIYMVAQYLLGEESDGGQSGCYISPKGRSTQSSLNLSFLRAAHRLCWMQRTTSRSCRRASASAFVSAKTQSEKQRDCRALFRHRYSGWLSWPGVAGLRYWWGATGPAGPTGAQPAIGCDRPAPPGLPPQYQDRPVQLAHWRTGQLACRAPRARQVPLVQRARRARQGLGCFARRGRGVHEWFVDLKRRAVKTPQLKFHSRTTCRARTV